MWPHRTFLESVSHSPTGFSLLHEEGLFIFWGILASVNILPFNQAGVSWATEENQEHTGNYPRCSRWPHRRLAPARVTVACLLTQTLRQLLLPAWFLHSWHWPCLPCADITHGLVNGIFPSRPWVPLLLLLHLSAHSPFRHALFTYCA